MRRSSGTSRDFRVADPGASAQITVRQLLTQISGLSEGAGRDAAMAAGMRALEPAVQALASTGDTAGNQFAQHRVQPADHLGAAQVTVALGTDLQQRRVIIGPDLPHAGRPQRGDGHRPGIAGVVLAGVPCGQ
jgi:hypothetical protein